MKKISIILFVLISTLTSAQGVKLKKADNYYSKLAYSEAVPLYLELIGSEIDSTNLKSKLANCYYQMGNTIEAEIYYTQVVTKTGGSSDDVYNYAQTLKENGNYQESDKWMDKFYLMKSSDSRGKQFMENKGYIKQIASQGVYFSINHLKINTENTEFGGYPGIGGEIYVVSNKTEHAAIKRYHTWNSRRFLDLYTAEVDENEELINLEFKSKKINKKFHEGPLCFSPDKKTVYYTRNNMSSGNKRRDTEGIQNLKIYISNINEEGKWINEREFPLNSKDYSVGHPTISADGKILYFVMDKPGGLGGSDIYKININEDGTFENVENMGNKINTEGQEIFPWVSSDDLLFFSSDGHLGLGGLDVFVMLPNKDGSFRKLMNVGKPVNGSNDDFALIMNSDNLSGYVSSNRSSGAGSDDMYSFALLKPFKVNLIVQGLITDYRSKEIIPNATIELVNAAGDVIWSTQADDEGFYSFELEEDQDYTINVSREDYFDNNGTLTTKNIQGNIEQIEKNLTLEKDPGLALYALVMDAKTNAVLEGVKIKIIDNITGIVFLEDLTKSTGVILKGIVDKKIDDHLSYNIELVKEGYFPKTVTFNYLITAPGQIDVNSLMKGGLTMDVEVEDLALLINPINFDLGKWNIRLDASIELDKIVEVMNKYPKMTVELGAHTDCRASAAFNMKLSDKRAKSSAKYIQDRITNPERISGKGYGETRLLNDCECEGSVKSDCSEEEHQANRRTEFLVISTGDDKVKVSNTGTDSFEH